MPKLIENLKEKIVIQGKAILIQGKYTDFNIREIAKKCGIGVGTVYNYFKNKDQLAYEIFKNDWDKTLEVVNTLKGKEGSLKEKLYEIYQSMEAFIDSYMSIFMEISAEKGGTREFPHEHYRIVYEKMEELVDSEKRRGNIKSEILSDKLSYFIISNMIYNIKNKYMSFEELYSCLKL